MYPEGKRCSFWGVAVRSLTFLAASLLAQRMTHAATITPGLKEAMDQAGPVTLIPVIIGMRDRVAKAELQAATKGLPKDESRSVVMGMLKKKAKETQADLLAYLAARAQEGEAANISPLWITNIVSAEVTVRVINDIAGMAEVATISLSKKRRMIPEPPRGTPMAVPKSWSPVGRSRRGAFYRIAVRDDYLVWLERRPPADPRRLRKRVISYEWGLYRKRLDQGKIEALSLPYRLSPGGYFFMLGPNGIVYSNYRHHSHQVLHYPKKGTPFQLPFKGSTGSTYYKLYTDIAISSAPSAGEREVMLVPFEGNRLDFGNKKLVARSRDIHRLSDLFWDGQRVLVSSVTGKMLLYDVAHPEPRVGVRGQPVGLHNGVAYYYDPRRPIQRLRRTAFGTDDLNEFLQLPYPLAGVVDFAYPSLLCVLRVERRLALVSLDVKTGNIAEYDVSLLWVPGEWYELWRTREVRLDKQAPERRDLLCGDPATGKVVVTFRNGIYLIPKKAETQLRWEQFGWTVEEPTR